MNNGFAKVHFICGLRPYSIRFICAGKLYITNTTSTSRDGNEAMKMTKSAFQLYAMLIISTSIAASAKSVKFETVILSKKEYKTTTNMTSDSRINYESDSNTLAKLRTNGLNFPIQTRQSQNLVTKMVTGVKRPDGGIPFSSRIDSFQLTELVNGIYNPQPTSTGVDTSLVFSGIHFHDSMIIQDLSANKIPPDLIPAVKTSIAKMIKTIKYPSKPMTEGDEFEQATPLSIPMPGLTEIKFEIITKYRLRKIKSTTALFDISQKYKLNSDAANLMIHMDGSGTGSMIYDIRSNYTTAINTTSTMNLRANTGKLAVIVQTETRSEMSVSVSESSANTSAAESFMIKNNKNMK